MSLAQVDEFQDVDQLQYRLLRMLLCDANGQLRAGSSLFVVGDVDQSIYSWRGADANVMAKQLPTDFPDAEKHELRDNYRCAETETALSHEEGKRALCHHEEKHSP